MNGKQKSSVTSLSLVVSFMLLILLFGCTQTNYIPITKKQDINFSVSDANKFYFNDGNTAYWKTISFNDLNSSKMPHATFLSTKTQTVGATNTAYLIDFNTTAENYGITRVGDTNFMFPTAGSYEAIISILAMSGTPVKRINVWFAKNGFAVPNSNTAYDFKGVNELAIIAVPFTFDVNTTDVLNVYYSSNDTSVILPYIAPASPAPATPSSVITFKWISAGHS